MNADTNSVTVRPLTSRQIDVVIRVCDGQTEKSIGYDLNISQKTVEFHLARVRERVGARSLAGLVRWAIRSGLIKA